MTTNEPKSKTEESTLETEKRPVKKIKKNYIELEASERANLKQLSKRKFISQKALKQIFALLLFDKEETMTEVMEKLAVSPQTLKKWRNKFKEKRMGSLLVVLKKKKEDDAEVKDSDEEVDKKQEKENDKKSD